MAGKKAGRGGNKDALGKLVMTTGNANLVIVAASLGAIALGVVLAVVGLFVNLAFVAGGALCVLGGGLGTWFGLAGPIQVFEVRAKGVRAVHRGAATEIRWEDVKKVVVQKSLLNVSDHGVMRITNLGDGTQEYRGERVMYEFTIRGGGERIVVRCGGKNPSIDPRRLLRQLEEGARGKVQVNEPDQEVYFDD